MNNEKKETNISIGKNNLIEIDFHNSKDNDSIVDIFGFNNNKMEIDWDLNNKKINKVICYNTSNIFEFNYLNIDYSIINKLDEDYYSVLDDEYGVKSFAVSFNKEKLFIILNETTDIDSYFVKDRIEYFYSKGVLSYITIKNLTKEEYNFLKEYMKKNSIKREYDIIDSKKRR